MIVEGAAVLEVSVHAVFYDCCGCRGRISFSPLVEIKLAWAVESTWGFHAEKYLLPAGWLCGQ